MSRAEPPKFCGSIPCCRSRRSGNDSGVRGGPGGVPRRFLTPGPLGSYDRSGFWLVPVGRSGRRPRRRRALDVPTAAVRCRRQRPTAVNCLGLLTCQCCPMGAGRQCFQARVDLALDATHSIAAALVNRLCTAVSERIPAPLSWRFRVEHGAWWWRPSGPRVGHRQALLKYP